MRRPLWHFSAAILLSLYVPGTWAAVTEISLPPFAIPIGWEVGLTIHHNLISAGGDCYSEQWRCLACDPPSAWLPDPANTQSESTFIRMMTQVGNYEFKGGAYEGDPGDAENPPVYAWNYLTKQVTVVGPDRDVLFNMPLTASTSSEDPLFMEMDVLFYLYNGSFLIGPNAIGDAQERIKSKGSNGQWGDWGNWVGPASGIFELIGVGAIYDFKTVLVGNRAAWDAMPVDTVFAEYYQQNRMITTDCGGTPRTYEFAVRHFQMKKSDDTSWSLNEI